MVMGMEIVVGILAIVVVLGLIYLVVQRLKPSEDRPAARREEGRPAVGPVVTLDIDTSEPDNPIVQRLVRDAAAQYFATHADAKKVEVRDRTGRELDVVTRERVEEEAPSATLPEHLYEPRARRHAPGPGGGADQGPGAVAHFDTSADAAPHRTLAELFDLPEAVHAKLQKPNDPVDLCRAILEAAGLEVRVDGDVLVSGDEALVVVDTTIGSPVRPDDLSQAFLRFQETKARSGVVVSPGLMYPEELKRRQAMAPNLLHAGPEGIQRMADAVALGANPLRFVTGPPVG